MGEERNWTYRCPKHPRQTFRRFKRNYPRCPICREQMSRLESETNPISGSVFTISLKFKKEIHEG